ncbi:MAG TPA: hypothetical protein VJI15_03165 [Candidatus Nanoarchaeia archaeon]|nr:hypothetical protein [Candidatus Nanoarchaeia archaeon]
MEELLLEAREELKRLEHIIYVTLKYTRTVDVLVNALQRLVDIYDLIIEALLEKAKAEKLVDSLAKSPALRAKNLQELYADDKQLENYLKFYTFIKNLLKSPYSKREEFRRHVTHVVELENSTATIDIDNLVNCERFSHQFFRYAWGKVVGLPEED